MSEYFKEFGKSFVSFFSNNGFNILAVIAILIIGYYLISLLSKLFLRIVYATKIDNAVGGFFVAVIKIALWILLFLICANILGIEGNSLLVAFSSIALAIGLALKDSLSNIANGLIIIFTKPFKKGDHIAVNGVEGKINKISIITTELYTFDNKKIVIPNSSIVANNVINYTASPTRRLDLTYRVSYSSDIFKVRKVLNDVIENTPAILKIPAPAIVFKAHSASSLDFEIKVWVNTKDYWTSIDVLNQSVFLAFKENKIEIPFNQIDVNFRNQLSLQHDEYLKEVNDNEEK